ncbi:MAG TPA: DUF1549 domain-containing protein [Methylomirabilota bacterium]|nr:DUF1549 domain-containing protein [Methylomirabilota bacterium]
MRIALLTACCCLALNITAALTPEQAATLPPPASHRVDFTKEIKPILEASCTKCHGRGKDKGGFLLDTRETFLKGGDSGPAVVVGKSAESYLIELVAAVDPENVMPIKGSKLSAEQVGLLRAWIDQGVAWDNNITFAKPAPLNLFPRKPAIPTAIKAAHPVDAFLAAYYQTHNVPPAKRVDDRAFVRRVYLDVLGVLPTPEETEDFLRDRRSNKRAALVQELLGDNRRYAEHWLTFWNDLLRNDYKGTGYIDGGRKQITEWLFSALSTNMPFKTFVAQLVNPPTPASEGFAKGIVWRGVVNASQTPEMQAAQNISQVFMGVNLKCASCHDSFINDWSLADAYGFASVYAEGQLEMVQCDRPLGKSAPTKFLYSELGTIDGKAPRPERLKQLEQIIISDKNARLTRTIVNRFWARFLGRGLVEPLDDMEQPAWNQDLLDWLAADFQEHGYDLRHLIARILTSEAYQRPAVGETEQAQKDFVFHGPLVRRMSAEQYIDALATVTGLGQNLPNAQINLRAADRKPSATLDSGVLAKWIWAEPNAQTKAPASTNYFRKTFVITRIPSEAHAFVAADNKHTVYLNGKEVGSGKDFSKLDVIDLLSHIKEGTNVIAIRAINDPAAPDKPDQDQANPAGLIAHIRLRSQQARRGLIIEHVHDFATDHTWRVSMKREHAWQDPEFSSEKWSLAVELGDAKLAPWNLAEKFEIALSNASLYGEVRAALVENNPLMVALGRPNREQVVSVRSSVATTLQGLELTNGETLARHFQRAADRLLQRGDDSTESLVNQIYTSALQRRPSQPELALVKQSFGNTLTRAQLEDVLWAVSMLPEFQLIY